MNILAFDTSSDACSVALLVKDASSLPQIISQHEIAPKQQAKLILPMIKHVLKSAALEFEQLDAIAYGSGPGSFTGLRLSSAIAQAIGYSNKIPILTVSSLTALAQSAHREYQWDKVLVGVDAKKGQLYFSACHVGDAGIMELEMGESLMTAQELILTDFYGYRKVGDAWRTYFSEETPHLMPSATAILDLAAIKFEKKLWISPINAIPVYLNPYKR